jgi:hypothetical protein
VIFIEASFAGSEDIPISSGIPAPLAVVRRVGLPESARAMLCHLHGLPSRLAVEESRMAGPMSGVKVVEMGVWVAGPAAGCVLADWGAEVLNRTGCDR